MLLCCLALSTGLLQSPADTAAFLAAAVDQPTPAARAQAVETLVQLQSVELDDWLAAAQEFAPLAQSFGAGTHTEQVTVWDGTAEVESEVLLHVPRSYDHSTPSPLLLALHGTGGDGASMLGLWTAAAEQHGMLLLCPSDPGNNVGFAASDAERLTTLAALRWARRQCNVDENAVFLSGFSRGGHLTWDLALRFPDRWAAIAPMVGGPRFELARGAANFRYFENLTHLPVTCLQGAKDQEGLVWSVTELFARFERAGFERARLHLFPQLGHNVDMSAVDWPAFFQQRRSARPERLVRTFARAGQGRNAWVEILGASTKVEEIFVPQIRQSQARRLGDEGLRRLVIDAAIDKTGRLEAHLLPTGSVELRCKKLTQVRFLLDTAMLPPAGKKWRVKLGSTSRKLKVEPSTSVLLTEFVERFDRTFLPVAEARLTVGR